MPLYDYLCPANGKTIEVQHSMSESISSWGELCSRAELDPGATPKKSLVKRVISVPGVFAKPGEPSGGGCCGVAGCGAHH